MKSSIKPNGTLLSFIHETHYFAMAQMVFYLIEHKHTEESDGCARNFIQIFNYMCFSSHSTDSYLFLNFCIWFLVVCPHYMLISNKNFAKCLCHLFNIHKCEDEKKKHNIHGACSMHIIIDPPVQKLSYYSQTLAIGHMENMFQKRKNWIFLFVKANTNAASSKSI